MGVTNAVRRQVLERANFQCEDCQAPAPKGRQLWCGLDIHHRERKRDGTDDLPCNLLVVCEECHMKRRHGKGAPSYGRKRRATPTDQAFLIKLPKETLEVLYEQAIRHKTSTRGMVELIVNEWLAARVAALEGRED